MRVNLAVSLIGILFIVSSAAFTQERSEGLINSGEILDKEEIEAKMEEEGIPNFYDGCIELLNAIQQKEPSITMHDAVTASLLPYTCVDAVKCMYNDPKNPTYDPDGNGTGQATIDHCIWPRKGNSCSENQCCDFKTVAKDGTKKAEDCDCITDSRGKCKTWKDCAKCMCYAESENEASECQLMTLCAMYNRAKAHKELDKNSKDKNQEEYICDVALYQGKSDAAQFTSVKCVCDESQNKNDQRGGQSYNQKYCKCCNGTASAPSSCESPLKNLATKCQTEPYSKVNSFVTKTLADPPRCSQVSSPSEKCKHKYFNCKYAPTSNPVSG
jgi:hypothetical protein